MTKTLKDIAAALHLDVRTGEHLLARTVTGGYAGDLLSDVLAHARKGSVWITLQTHTNIVAVASAKELCGIIVVNGRTPEEATLRKAGEEDIPIMVSTLSTYDVVCQLCEMGVKNGEGV
ncbi:MAG: DRTGG domain-containing protein [Acidobacteria bacterium]|nr:DRTGG domain-containing protein [Acidobacteriota bacterium]MCL5288061.1 DRTGG domain-containing protein [Acidobacteriota bacterium]